MEKTMITFFSFCCSCLIFVVVLIVRSYVPLSLMYLLSGFILALATGYCSDRVLLRALVIMTVPTDPERWNNNVTRTIQPTTISS